MEETERRIASRLESVDGSVGEWGKSIRKENGKEGMEGELVFMRSSSPSLGFHLPFSYLVESTYLWRFIHPLSPWQKLRVWHS